MPTGNTTNINGNQLIINVSDILPPENFATIDSGSLVGTVYTKAQNNEWREVVEAAVTTSIKGVAKPDDVITTTGFYRMLANIADTYTNYLDINDAPIVVTDTDLNIVSGVQRNEVIFEITNGVAEKKVYAKVGNDGANGTATIPQWVAGSYAPDAMVIYDFVQYITPTGAVFTDIPGVSDKWVSLGGSNEVEKILKSFLNPKIQTDTLLTMPQPLEKTDASMTINYQQYPLQGFNNGDIIVSSIPINQTLLIIEGDFTIGGTGTLWLAGVNDAENRYDQLLKGVASQTSYSFPIRRDLYTRYVYTRQNLNQVYKTAKTEDAPIEEESVKKYIDFKTANSGIKIGKTMILAENYGVSSVNTSAENGLALNKLFNDHKATGLSIYLPEGNILYDRQLNMSNRNSLYGVGWGNEKEGGTRLISSTANAKIVVERYDTSQDSYQSGNISNLTFDGNNVASVGLELGFGVAYGYYSKLGFLNFTDVCFRSKGALIYTVDNCRFMSSPRGVEILGVLSPSIMRANLIKFTNSQWIWLKNNAVNIEEGSNLLFEFCDFELIGSASNLAKVMTAKKLSSDGEGIDITLNSCWSEMIYGDWLDLSQANGTTVIRDTMLWALTGAGGIGVKNNGSKVLIDGSTKINDFSTNILTTNNGTTRTGGFANIGTTVENTGGVKKVQQWI